MYKKDGFITPSEHVNFLAKNLFGACGQIVNGAIAYLAPDGGGPVTPHTHATDHLFIVTQGEAKVLLDGQERIIRENEAFVVKGGIPHSVWNNAQAETVMIGITLKNNEMVNKSIHRTNQFRIPCPQCTHSILVTEKPQAMFAAFQILSFERSGIADQLHKKHLSPIRPRVQMSRNKKRIGH